MSRGEAASPPSAAIINAIVEPVVDVIRSCVGVDAQIGGLTLTEEIDPPPKISVTIQFRGRLRGPVTWVFTEALARACAVRMMAGVADAGTMHDAVAELANIASGNATGALAAAGYHIDITPPRVVPGDTAHRMLTERTLAVSLDTAVGPIKVIIGVEVEEEK